MALVDRQWVMPSWVHVISQLRLWVLVWVIAWATTVPLFHIHLPDISESLVSQGGVAHIRFSLLTSLVSFPVFPIIRIMTRTCRRSC